MSVSHYAYAVIGCEVPTNKLYRVVSIEHKEHPWPPDAKFCPTCGRETVVLESEPIYDDDNNKLDRFDVVWSTDKERAPGFLRDWAMKWRPTARPINREVR